jgi:hypothetical protein
MIDSSKSNVRTLSGADVVTCAALGERRAPRPPRQKNDPKFIKAARELRDRFLEEVNSPGSRFLPAGTQA